MHQRDRLALQQAVGAALRTLRLRAGLGQERMAIQAEVDRAYTSGLELGKHNPTLLTIFRFLPLLGVTFTEFAAELERQLAHIKGRKGRIKNNPP
jgi:transcriptional regulator with XRE-family HTH domain